MGKANSKKTKSAVADFNKKTGTGAECLSPGRGR